MNCSAILVEFSRFSFVPYTFRRVVILFPLLSRGRGPLEPEVELTVRAPICGTQRAQDAVIRIAGIVSVDVAPLGLAFYNRHRLSEQQLPSESCMAGKQKPGHMQMVTAA